MLNGKISSFSLRLRALTPVILMIPSLAILVVFIVGSLVFLLVYVGDISGAFAKVVSKPYFQAAYLRTLRVALTVALITTVLAYPSAFYVLHLSPRRRQLVKALIWLPVMINPIIRGYGWMIILGRKGLINSFLLAIGVVKEPIRILYTEAAMAIGLTELFFPFLFVSLLGAMENISDEVVMAAYSLGAGMFRVFKDIIVPQSIKGYIFGITVVVTGCATAFVTPTILGGSQNATLSMLLWEYVSLFLDWRTAAVIALIIIGTVLAISELASYIARRV